MLNQLAAAAGWGARPSPGPDEKTGEVTVPRVTAILDTGLIINPDLVKQQIEGNTHVGIDPATGPISPDHLGKQERARTGPVPCRGSSGFRRPQPLSSPPGRVPG